MDPTGDQILHCMKIYLYKIFNDIERFINGPIYIAIYYLFVTTNMNYTRWYRLPLHDPNVSSVAHFPKCMRSIVKMTWWACTKGYGNITFSNL